MKKCAKLITLALALILLALPLAACGGGSDGQSQATGSSSGSAAAGGDGAATGRDDVVIGIPQALQYLTAGRSNGTIASVVYTQMYNRLLSSPGGNVFEPELATSWEISPDGLVYTFKLREDVTFHNGDKFTAEDVQFTMDYHSGKLPEYPTGTQAAVNLPCYDHCVILDEYTVEMHLSEPYSPALAALTERWVSILPKNAFLEAGEDAFEENPIGTGPYRFVSTVPGQNIILTAYEGHYGGTPAIKDITFSIRQDIDSSVIALQTGELDFVTNVDASYMRRIEDDANLSWYMAESWGYVWLTFNTGLNSDIAGSEFFSDVRVRQAVALAIDKEDINIALTDGLGQPVHSIVPTSYAGYTPTDDYYPQNIERAKELLAEAGYPNGFSVSITTTNTPTYYKPAEALIGQLAEIGITAQLEILESGAYWPTIMTDHTYHMAIGMANSNAPDADTPLSNHYFSNARLNCANFVNTHTDELILAARGEQDITKREEMYKEVTDILLGEDCVVVPLCSFMITGAGNAQLKNVVAGPFADWNIYQWSW